MKKRQAFWAGVLLSVCLSISIGAVASENGKISGRIQSKGVVEFYDEQSDSRTIIDAKDIWLLADEIDKLDESLDETKEAYQKDLDIFFKKVDMLDGKEDMNLCETELEKSYEKLADSIKSYANKEIISNNAKESNTEYSYIKIPKDGFYTKDSYIKVSNNILTNANKELTKTIEKEVLKNIEIHEKTGSLRDNILCDCFWETSYVGGCTIIIGTGRERYSIWTNNTDQYVKFLPGETRGDCSLQGAATIAPGESVYAYLNAYLREKPGGTGNWGTYYGQKYQESSGTYKYYLLY